MQTRARSMVSRRITSTPSRRIVIKDTTTAVANEPAFDFDLGPLSWVASEIDQALSRGLEALATFGAQPKDVTALKHARTHIHQAAGAIQTSRLLRESERRLAEQGALLKAGEHVLHGP